METIKQTTIQFNNAVLQKVQEIIKRYPEGKHKSALIPILHIAQAEFDGWLSAETMDYVAEILQIQPIEVYEVASFYSMFNLQPVGKTLIEVCQTSSCWMSGAEDIIDYIIEKYNIEENGTSSDGQFTLKKVECLGACGGAPMLQIGEKYFENLTLDKIDIILENEKVSGKRSKYC